MPVLTISPEEEARVVRVAAARSGCRVEDLRTGATNFGQHAMGHVVCPDGWAAARMVVALGIEYAKTPGLRDYALWLRQQAPSDEAYARLVHAHVKELVRFVKEEGEVFQGPSYTLAAGAGDCDDQAILSLALALAGGLPAIGAFLHAGGDPTHALAMFCPNGLCAFAETTVDARYGEHPIAAATRTGVLQGRDDLARQEVVTMSEKDLAPIPADYEANNPGPLTLATSRQLVSLGYLDAGAETSDPADPVFRAAVLALQLAHPPMVADGLTGPATRAMLGELTGVTVAPTTTLTAHISDGFLRTLLSWAADKRARGARVNAYDFLSVWQSESGISPASKNSLGFAGLNGMGAQERAAVGFSGTIDDWTALSPDAQLPYVLRYYELDVVNMAKGDWSALTDVGALYLLNFLPAYIGQAGNPSFVLASRGNDPHGWYAANPGLDVGHKGWIEVGDMAKTISIARARVPAKMAELVARLESLGGDVPSEGDPVSAVTIAGVLVAATALGGALAEYFS